MKILKIILGIIVGLFAITFVAELIEFFTVKLVSKVPFSELTSNQEMYFNIRNTTWILIFKIFYSLLAGFVGGYLAAWISAEKAKITIYILIATQVLSLAWAGFISELGAFGPSWMWVYLIIIVPVGIWLGYKKRTSR